MPHGIRYSKLYLVPQIENELIEGFPFSYELLGQSLYNGFHRESHGTLDNSDVPKLFGIIFMFLNLNRNCQYDEQLVHRSGMNDLLTLPLTNENNYISDELRTCLTKCIA